MKQLKCGCIEDEVRKVTVFRCKNHKKFTFERDPDIKITKVYFNGELVYDAANPDLVPKPQEVHDANTSVGPRIRRARRIVGNW